MKRYKIGIIIVILFVIGVFSFTISTKDIFFTTNYYKNPLDAYNATSTYDALYGTTTAKRQIGILSLDDNNHLFIGEINENCFVVDEIESKNGKYASKGSAIFYNLDEKSDKESSNLTQVSNGYVKWAIMYNENEIVNLSNVVSIHPYTLTDTQTIYLVIYDN